MINSELGHCKDVKEFNTSIREQQETAHGAEYCGIHDAIQKYLPECNSYMELGTHQGGTASAALLCNPTEICLIDIDTSRYNKFLKPLAETYCKENNIKLDVRQTSSVGFGSVNPTDMLVIDSYHHPDHMMQELKLHGTNVKKYIIAHDTSIVNGKPNESLFKVLQKFAQACGWTIIERETRNVGYTVLKKNA
jgi:hypothetical protein